MPVRCATGPRDTRDKISRTWATFPSSEQILRHVRLGHSKLCTPERQSSIEWGRSPASPKFFAEEDILPVVAAMRDVVRFAGNHHPCKSSHASPNQRGGVRKQRFKLHVPLFQSERPPGIEGKHGVGTVARVPEMLIRPASILITVNFPYPNSTSQTSSPVRDVARSS